MRCLRLSWLLAALIASPAAAQPRPAQAQAVSAEQQRALDWAVQRGRTLFALDRAAWVATDDMRERIPDPVAAGIAGYVVDKDDQGYFVIFFAREGGKLTAAYRARVGQSGVTDAIVYPAGQRPELTPVQVRLARAFESVRRGSVENCTRSAANVAVVPPERPDGPIDIYVTAPQMNRNAVQFGGHQRITLDAEGRETGRRSYTRSCIEVPVPGEVQRRQGAMIGISHLLDPMPTEIHVFIAMSLRAPLVVITENPQRLWEVTGERIRVLQDGPLQKAPS